MSLIDRAARRIAQQSDQTISSTSTTRRRLLQSSGGGLLAGLLGASIGGKALAQTACPGPPPCIYQDYGYVCSYCSSGSGRCQYHVYNGFYTGSDGCTHCGTVYAYTGRSC